MGVKKKMKVKREMKAIPNTRRYMWVLLTNFELLTPNLNKFVLCMMRILISGTEFITVTVVPLDF